MKSNLKALEIDVNTWEALAANCNPGGMQFMWDVKYLKKEGSSKQY